MTRLNYKHLLLSLLGLFLVISLTWADKNNLDEAWNQAAAYASQTGMDTAVQEKIAARDVHTLHQVAKHQLQQQQNQLQAAAGLKTLHALADEAQHLASQVTLGFYYYQKAGDNSNLDDKLKALKYFSIAGQEGPHQAALYNAGRIYGELGEWIPALAFVRTAATLGHTHPTAVTDALTQTCLTAYNVMRQQLSQQTLGIQQWADIFLYSNLQDFPADGSPQADLWTHAVMALDLFNRTFSESNGKEQNHQAMLTAFENLHQLWETASTQLSDLQAFILLQQINDMLGLLAGLDDKYISAAAGYAEALAMSPYCHAWAAATEPETSCFNEAAVAAVAYYRRVKDQQGAQRVVELGRSHPTAATHWDLVEQTPRVYHTGLTSQPWWPNEGFPTAIALAQAFASHKNAILQELRNVQALQEGLQPTTGSGSGGNAQEAQVQTDGTTTTTSTEDEDDSKFGFRRISTPYIGLRTDQDQTRTTGAGGWAEFGPLFDGRGWKQDKCAYTPTLCQVIQQDPSSLCTHGSTPETVEQVLQNYGTDTLVTLLRLRPGTHILPHNGTTNRRLIMHFCLQGCEGIQFTVGGKTVTSYGGGDGSVIVFDDSFEHSVYHAGKQDRFVLVAVLAHPETRNV